MSSIIHVNLYDPGNRIYMNCLPFDYFGVFKNFCQWTHPVLILDNSRETFSRPSMEKMKFFGTYHLDPDPAHHHLNKQFFHNRPIGPDRSISAADEYDLFCVVFHDAFLE